MIRFYCIALLVLLQLQVFGQGVTVTGKVSDAGDRSPMPGVTVLEKGTTNGVITNFDGEFKINLTKKDATILFSFIGYDTQFVQTKGKIVFDIKLEAADQQLGEVVVLGYGSVKSREAVVGSVEQVKSADLLKHSNAQSVDQMLEGQVAGVQIDSDSGDPTSPVKVRIRGNNSLPDLGSSNFTASSEPLYILDGVPLIDALNPNVNTGTETVINPLALINPEDIASISILKDASAAAIYGANAANGVIIITTKKGTVGKTRVTFSQKTIYSTPINKIEYLNGEQYVELSEEFYRNSGYNVDDIPDLIGATDVYTNWRDLTLQNGMSNLSNLTISGGSEKSTFRLSLGYKDNETTTKGNDFESINSRLSLDTKLAPGISLSYVGGLTSFKADKYSAFATYAYKPNISVYDENGDLTQMETYANPLADLAQNENNSKKFYSNNALTLKAKVSKNFSIRSMFGLDYTSTKKFTFYSKENGRGRKNNGYLRESRSENLNWIANSQLEYNGSYKQNTISASAGIQLKHDQTNSTSSTEKNMISEKIKVPGQSDTEDSTVKGSESESASRSYYGRVNYDFAKKYFMAISFRSDASSYFGGDQKVENFASIGGSWILSKENFWIENDIVNFVKLKASYGKLGNAKVGSYSARGLYGYNTSSNYNGKLVATPYTAPNEDLGWQTSFKFNTGLTIKFLKKFGLDVEYYNNKTKDGIMNLSVVPETGWNRIAVNTADLTNYGLEFTVKAKDINLGEVRWGANFNIGFNKSRLDKLNIYANRLISGAAGLIVGKSTALIMGAKYAGVNPENGNPQWYKLDGTLTENTSDISGNDRKFVIGKSDPDFSGGFSNSFSYKGFSLSCMLSFEYGADKMMPYPAREMENGRSLYNFNKSVNLIDRWQKPGDITDIPRLDQGISYNAYSDRFLFDQTNLSLRSISLKYSLPKHICESIRLANASLGVNVTNVYTWYKESGESGRNGLAEYRYPFPQSRMYGFQLSLGI